MYKIRPAVSIALFFTALILAGCSTTKKLYTGPELPESQIAIVEVASQLGVVSVDGVKPRGIYGGMQPFTCCQEVIR